jgi:hypothetical protein
MLFPFYGKSLFLHSPLEFSEQNPAVHHFTTTSEKIEQDAKNSLLKARNTIIDLGRALCYHAGDLRFGPHSYHTIPVSASQALICILSG